MSTETLAIKITKTKESRINEVDFNNIPFGKVFSDHMFTMDYKDGEWSNPEILPFGKMLFSPAMSSIHYGQSIFEGMKAFRKDGEVYTFRAKDNFARLNRSADRMCMPNIPNELVMSGLKELLRTDKEWIPENETNSLYIRPFMFATDEYVGIRPSETYKFMIFCCPVGNYYSEPLKVKIETHFTRAANGGVGEAKAAGNYASSLYPAKLANEQGYHQLLWTDSKEHKYIEESGTMNVMFVINNTLITPSLSGTILPGITRNSVLTIAKDWGYNVEERQITVTEVIEAIKNGTLTEAFGAGTAATIAQIQTIGLDGMDYELPEIKGREFSNRVLKFLNNIKRGQETDKWGWIDTV
jgi:branched-chain amino acid aminotransferase|tara:strand:- start:171 stop:1235 length:1065 start_codon:yes stop_codon:yes gene_type:complete